MLMLRAMTRQYAAFFQMVPTLNITEALSENDEAIFKAIVHSLDEYEGGQEEESDKKQGKGIGLKGPPIGGPLMKGHFTKLDRRVASDPSCVACRCKLFLQVQDAADAKILKPKLVEKLKKTFPHDTYRYVVSASRIPPECRLALGDEVRLLDGVADSVRDV
eukprot:gene57768-biopygen36511